jgi:hypothetical protein
MEVPFWEVADIGGDMDALKMPAPRSGIFTEGEHPLSISG